MTVREMRSEDMEQVTKLAGQLGYPSTVAEMSTRFQKMSESKSHALFVATEMGTNVLGWLQVNCEADTLISEPRAEITALVVDESARGQNIGKLLLERAERWAKDNLLQLVRVRSNVKRTDAHRFYLREGYEIQKSWHLFVKELK